MNLILITLVSSAASFAVASTNANDMLTNTIDCPLKKHDAMGDLQAIARAASAEFGGKSDMPSNVGGGTPDADWGKACGKFFDSQGNYGQYGNMVNQSLDPSKNKSLFESSKDLDMICPGFAALGNDDKKKFWVWTLSATAYKESTCKEKGADSKGPNGTAAGLFQLHKGKEASYPTVGQKCRNGDSGNGNNSIQCTISMLSHYKEKSQGLFVTSGKTYWATFRVDNAKVDKNSGMETCTRVAQFPGCGSGTTQSEAKKRCADAFQQIKAGGKGKLASK